MYAIISKFSVTVRITQTQEKHKRGIWDVENFKVPTFSLASYETEIYPIKNNIFCINSFRARNPIMPCNYWMWISCDHFDAVEWMCAAAPLSFSSRISYMHACMHVYHSFKGQTMIVHEPWEKESSGKKLKAHHTFICSSVIQFLGGKSVKIKQTPLCARFVVCVFANLESFSATDIISGTKEKLVSCIHKNDCFFSLSSFKFNFGCAERLQTACLFL